MFNTLSIMTQEEVIRLLILINQVDPLRELGARPISASHLRFQDLARSHPYLEEPLTRTPLSHHEAARLSAQSLSTYVP